MTSFSHHSPTRVQWLIAPKGVPTPPYNPCVSLGQMKHVSSPHSFLANLAAQPDISQLLQTNHTQHQANLIHHDLDNIENKDTLVNHLLSADILSISTHNTRIIYDTTKYAQLIETLTLHKIDICGVTETGHDKGQKYKFQHHPTYSAFWSSSINRHAGVGLILHRKWCTYIQNTFLQHDRFIYVDLFFKGCIKVRIIVVYIHADPTAKQQRLVLQAQLIDLLRTSQAQNYHTIIMGDFNANLERFYSSTRKHNKGA